MEPIAAPLGLFGSPSGGLWACSAGLAARGVLLSSVSAGRMSGWHGKRVETLEHGGELLGPGTRRRAGAASRWERERQGGRRCRPAGSATTRVRPWRASQEEPLGPAAEGLRERDDLQPDLVVLDGPERQVAHPRVLSLRMWSSARARPRWSRSDPISCAMASRIITPVPRLPDQSAAAPDLPAASHRRDRPCSTPNSTESQAAPSSRSRPSVEAPAIGFGRPVATRPSRRAGHVR